MPLPSITKADSAKEPVPGQEVAALARCYGRHVFEAAFRVLGSHAQAEDVQQEVFLRLLEKPMGQVASWPALLTTLAVRLSIDHLRRGKRWRRLQPIWLAGITTTTASAEDEASQIERAASLRREIARLRPREAECFTLRCVQGFDIAAIAAATGLRINHVSVCLHRATRTLESRLGDASNPAPEIPS
ncbi:MAG: RNA polymerase sigma factor [Gammaproteobacteria bacterium]